MTLCGKYPTLAVRQLTEKMLLEHYAPPCVIINEQSDILYIYGRTGKYLEHAAGEASLNLLRMARDGLRMLLSGAIRQVISQKEPVIYERIEVKSYSESLFIRLTVRPMLRPAAMQGLIMVIFEDLPPPKVLSSNTDISELSEEGSSPVKSGYVMDKAPSHSSTSPLPKIWASSASNNYNNL